MQTKAGQFHLAGLGDLIEPSQNTFDLVRLAPREPPLIVVLKDLCLSPFDLKLTIIRFPRLFRGTDCNP